MYTFITFFVLVFNTINCHCPVYFTLQNEVVIIHWNRNCETPPHKLRIFDKNPYLSNTSVITEVNPSELKLKYFITNTKFSDLVFPQKWQKNHQQLMNNEHSNCLNFYVLSFNKSNHVTNFECLRINPQWMSETKEIHQFPLKHLLIPGTKCSACYMTPSNSKRRNLKFKQNFDIWQQLVMGVRYLEFSVGYFRSFHGVLDIKGRFFVFNEKSNQEISSIFPLLEDIKRFVVLSNEIVIIDFKEFVYGFHDVSLAHEIFMKLLQDTFEDVAILNERNGTNCYDLTIEKMRNCGKNLLILYNHKDVCNRDECSEMPVDILWPSWHRITADSKNIEHSMSKIFSATDNDNGWILDVFYGSANESSIDRVVKINSQILSSLDSAVSLKANVVPLDYIFSTNLIEVSIYVNQQKALLTHNHIVVNV